MSRSAKLNYCPYWLNSYRNVLGSWPGLEPEDSLEIRYASEIRVWMSFSSVMGEVVGLGFTAATGAATTGAGFGASYFGNSGFCSALRTFCWFSWNYCLKLSSFSYYRINFISSSVRSSVNLLSSIGYSCFGCWPAAIPDPPVSFLSLCYLAWSAYSFCISSSVLFLSSFDDFLVLPPKIQLIFNQIL